MTPSKHHDRDAFEATAPPATGSGERERFAGGQIVAGRYRILTHLGSGRMGEVYRAEDLNLGVTVALKFLRSEGPQPLQWLLEEVRLAREITHPAVCRVFDVGEAEGQTFFTMEYVDGEDLASLLRRIGGLPFSKVRELAGELCAGLAAAHVRGVLHRDLKPANIMLDAAGRIRILDFGIAIGEGGRDRRQIGTPAYMAPEQLRPGAPETEQTDLYALGLVLYELVSGRPVFPAATVDEREMLQTGTPAPPSTRGAELDARFEEGILRALREDPGERPASARALADLLGVDIQERRAEKPAATLPGESGERRHLTVMFCDLVDSSGLSQRLDPEAYVRVVQRYRSCCAEAVARYDGHVAQYLGDGVLVYFGYPRAHEEDAERAVRAGLEIVRGVQALDVDGDDTVSARIGIHTGGVVLTGSGTADRREMLALGVAPNIAARLQAIAEPNEVVISDATLALVAGLFATEDLGAPELKGIAEPIRLHRVLQPSGMRSRLERALALTPFVGRAQELGLLVEHFEQVQEGRGQVVLISGEAGIGKSRLAHELRKQLGDVPHSWLELRTTPYTRSSPLHPLIEMLEAALDLQDGDTSADRLAKLERGVAQIGLKPTAAVSLLAGLLSLPLPERYPSLEISPQLRRQRTLETLLSWVLALGEKQPLVLVVEDLHWIDPSTLEWLGLLIQQCPTASVLLLLTYRPEFEPPWSARGHLLPVALSRLGHRQTKDLVAAPVSGGALPDTVIDRLAARSDGIPLFVEELAKGFVESGRDLTGPLSDLEIPETLQDSLTARLDRLGAAKEVAQLGAVLGREFPYALLEAVAPWPRAALREALGRLMDAELLYQRGLLPGAIYSFKHALVQDTAYQSLLESQRREIHGRIADTLDAHFPERVAREPELIAHHCEKAGRTREAIGHYRRAGERATQHFAHAEAIGHLRTALELLHTLPESAERDRQELQLQVVLGPSLIVTKSYGDPEVGQAYGRARDLCREVGETPELVRALVGLSLYEFIRGDLQTGRDLAEWALALAERMGESFPLVMAHTRLGINLYVMGETVRALDHFEQAIRFHDPVAHRTLQAAWGQGVGVDLPRAFSAYALWHLGYPDRARRLIEEAVELVREGDPFDLAQALANRSHVHHLLRERDQTLRWAEETIGIARERGFAAQLLIATLLRGWALGGSRGLEEMQQGLAQAEAAGIRSLLPGWLGIAAETNLEFGRTEEALAAVEAALGIEEETGGRAAHADLQRLKGEALLQQGAAEEAERCLRRSLEVARGRQTKATELRAATSLGRLLRDQGRGDEARELLAPVYDWFTEGLDTADLKDAKALLDELAQA